jgi:hypothetical protein
MIETVLVKKPWLSLSLKLCLIARTVYVGNAHESELSWPELSWTELVLQIGASLNWCDATLCNIHNVHSHHLPLLWCCRRFETGGSLSRRVSVLRAPAQMGRARGRARRGERRGGRRRTWERWKSRGLRVRPAPRSGALAVGGLQASTRAREASGPKRAPVPSSVPRGQPPLRGPCSFLL